MGFESFTVLLTPCAGPPLQGEASVERLADDIQRQWPSVCADYAEPENLEYPQRPGDVFLFSQTEAGLFQIKLSASGQSLSASLRFALCNPRAVYGPFCEMVSWLMHCYGMQCHVGCDPPSADVPTDFCDPNVVTAVLTPSMDYNRWLWQQDAGSAEEHSWRPGDAQAWFVNTRCVLT